MKLEIISPDKRIFEGEVSAIQLPGTEGSFGLLDNHAPMISTLKVGKIKITNPDKEEHFFEINGGVVEVQKNKVIVLAE